MRDVNGQVHLMALMDAAFRELRRELDATLAERVGLRSSQLRVLDLTPAEGSSLTDLAARARMTKQALGELVSGLVEAGHLELDADPLDRRVRIVRPTPRGLRLVRRMQEEIAALEARCAAQVGPRRWATFRAVLAEVGGPDGPGAGARP